MVNFRYHLVSIIAIFIALCVGVILGAGPLQVRLDDALSSSRAQAQRTAQEQLEEAEHSLKLSEAAVSQMGDEIVPGTLEGRNIGLLKMAATDPADIEQLKTMLSKAGATVVSVATLTDSWDSQSMTEYRNTLATPVETNLAGDVPADLTSDGVIGQAIVTIMTSSGANQDLLRDILTDDSRPIVTFDESEGGQADTLILVGPRTMKAGMATAQDAQSGTGGPASSSAWVGMARALASAPNPGVIVGDAGDADAMIAQLRAQNAPITTVDSVGTAIATLATVLALPSAQAQPRALGGEDSATSVFPDLQLSGRQVAPPAPHNEPADGAQSQSGGE